MPFGRQDYNEGLLGLVQALQQGLDPSTAYSLYGDLAAQRAQAVAARQQRLAAMTQLLTQGAASGMTETQAGVLADVQPGPMGPAVQNILSTLYPAQAEPGLTGYGAAARTPGVVPVTPQGPPDLGLSPLYQQPSQLEQLQQEAAGVEAMRTIAGGIAPGPAAPAPELLQLVDFISSAQASGSQPAEIKAAIMSVPETRAIYVQYFPQIAKMFPILAAQP